MHSPLRSPLKRQSSVHSGRLGSTKSLSAAVFTDKPPPVLSGGVQFSSEVSRSDENVLDSPHQRRSYGSFPFTPSADSNTFHQYRSADSSMSVADSEAYFSAAEDFEPISSADEGPGTYPGRKKKRRQQMQQPQQPAYHMDNYRCANTKMLQSSIQQWTCFYESHSHFKICNYDGKIEHMVFWLLLKSRIKVVSV